MAILDSTIMGEDANSYVNQTYADNYFDRHFNATKRTAWSALDDEQKQQVLVQGCWSLEQLRFTNNSERSNSVLHWDSNQNRFTAYITPSASPVPYSSTQALQFPRNFDVDSSGAVYIPERVQMAQCEQAIYLVSLDETALANRLQGINLDRVALGELVVTQEYAYQGIAIAPLAYEFVKSYLFRSTRIGRA